MRGLQLTAEHLTFLSRFEPRGWLSATRDNADEQAAVDVALRKRWLRRELGEAHFTPKGREGLAKELSA